MTCKEISEKLGVTYDAVVAAAHSAGFTLKRGRVPVQFSVEDVALIESKIVKKGSKKNTPAKKTNVVTEKKPKVEKKSAVEKNSVGEKKVFIDDDYEEDDPIEVFVDDVDEDEYDIDVDDDEDYDDDEDEDDDE